MTQKRIFLLVLAVLLALGAFFFLRYCNPKTIEMPWGLWETIQTGVQQSPDHLEAQANQVALTKDADQVFAFVRDRIQTIPNPIGAKPVIRWGTTGALRTAKATPLEKSILLQQLFERAGFTAEIYRGKSDRKGLDIFAQEYQPTSFTPDIDVSYLQQLQTKHGVTSGSEITSIVPDAEFEQLLDSIYQHIGQGLRIKDYNWGQLMYHTYPVRVMVDSQWVYFNPAFSDAERGVHYCVGEPRPFRVEAGEVTPKITIRLRASYDDRSYSPFTVAEAIWPVDQLIGKDVRLSYKLIGPPELLLSGKVSDFEAFVPCIDLIGGPAMDADSFHITGDVLTTRGKVVPKDAALQLLNHEQEIATTDPSKAASISLKLPKVADFPTVLLEAEVKDEEGNALMGLTEEDFSILVNGEKVTHRMVINQAMPPRVLFLYDDSESMPDKYWSYKKHEGTLDIFKKIAKACQEINPETEFRASPFGDKLNKIYKLSSWSNSIPKMEAYIKNTSSSESNNWSALLGAMSIEADMVILVCDADGTEKFDDYSELKFKEGMPGLIYGVVSRMTKDGEFEAMADKTGGAHFLIENQMDEAIADIQKRIKATKNERYLVEIDVENEELPLMDIQMDVGPDGDLFDKLEDIEIPGLDKRRPAGKNAITGLYLEVEYLDKKYVRKLAGVPLGANPKLYPITQRMIDECNNALLGEYLLHFEGDHPTPSAAMDQICGHYLQLRPLTELLLETDPEAFFKQLQETLWVPDYPAKWSAIMARKKDAGKIFENNLNAWLFSEYPDHTGQLYQRLDRLPMSDYLTAVPLTKEVYLEQAKQSLLGPWTVAKNYRDGQSVVGNIFPFEQVKINYTGQEIFFPHTLSNRSATNDWYEANNQNIVNTSMNLLIQDTLGGDLAFKWKTQNGNLQWMQKDGSMASKKLPLTIDREKSLIDNPGLWRKTMGMKMDTWMDLEGNKLAFIQVGTVAMKNLRDTEDPKVLMQKVKEELKVYIQTEMAYGKRYFFGESQQFMELYSIARNNLSVVLKTE
ncbi:MAG: hypothetical protein DHS20C18_39500 [Saprospiraceae bacterium]|nr:MAG: hypothetical protein DHS20C18_39500 [Saprospiraceae bacterium]